MRGVMIVLGGGAVLWYLNSKGYLSFLGTSTTPPANTGTGTTGTGTGTTGTGTTGTGTGTTPTPSQLDQLFTLVKNAAGSQALQTGLTPYQWNYYLAQVSPLVPPDPQDIFPGTDTQVMTAVQYWTAMGPALHAQFGLSGLSGSRGIVRQMRPIGWA